MAALWKVVIKKRLETVRAVRRSPGLKDGGDIFQKMGHVLCLPP